MDDRTIVAVLYELYCDGELAGKINREGRVPELCCDKALAAILARLKSEVERLKVDIRLEITEWLTHETSEEAESHNKAIDQVLKVLESELTNGK